MAFPFGKKKGPTTKGLGRKEKQFLHLKEFSQGKPNELSLNVLEQKAAAQDEEQQGWRPHLPALPARSKERKERTGRAEKKSTARPSSAPVTAPAEKKPASRPSFMGADSQAEIAARQRRRRAYRRMSLVVVIALCAGLIGVGGYMAYQHFERLSTSVGVLKEACSIVAQSDETTVAIDAFFQQPFDDNTVDTANTLVTEIPDAREQLSSARVYAQQAQGELEGSQRDKEAADRALNSIAARETLLDVSEQRLKDDAAAKQAIDALDEAWDDIQQGNSLLSQAAQVVADTTEDNVGKSTEYTTQANGKFADARSAIEKAQGLYPSADMTTALSYLAKRQEAAAEALQSNAAILIQDKATAEAHNDVYNAADNEAVELAKQLPSNFSQPVVDAYAANTADLEQKYNAARDDAATNDAFLRAYLGSS